MRKRQTSREPVSLLGLRSRHVDPSSSITTMHQAQYIRCPSRLPTRRRSYYNFRFFHELRYLPPLCSCAKQRFLADCAFPMLIGLRIASAGVFLRRKCINHQQRSPQPTNTNAQKRQFYAMRLTWRIGQKKSASTLSDVFLDSSLLYATCPPRSQQGTLALPTKLDEVVGSVHEFAPQQLPGEQATQDDVRYFLYQILTLKDYKLARHNPQWILETCMLWHGEGSKLRSLPLDAFQQLCPLHRGYATIDWTVKDSKFRPQDMPPCGVRDEIGHRIRNMVEGLKRKEDGHRGPGWRNSSEPKKLAVVRSGEMGRMQTPAPPLDHRVQMPSFATAPENTLLNHFYSPNNHPLPLLHQMSPVGVQQNPPCMQRRVSFAASQYGPPVTEPVQRLFSPQGSIQLVPDGKACDQSSPVSPLASHLSFHCQTESISSRLTESTAKTSPPGSESERNLWASKSNRPMSIAQPIAGSQCSSSGVYQASAQRTSAATRTRYKGSHLSSPTQLDSRSYNSVRHMPHLRSGSGSSTSTTYAPSVASLTPSDSATNQNGFRRDTTMPPELMQQSLRSQSLFYPAAASNLSQLSAPQTFVTALPYTRDPPSRLSPALPMVHDQANLARPTNNYKVDAHALDTAEHVGFKSMPGRARSLMVNEERRLRLTRGNSDGGLDAQMNDFCSNGRGGKESVGPFMRFQNPRTGQPRLTIYETIEQKERLGKQYLENQRRVDTLKTVYETIEEQEALNGRPQRGIDTCVGSNWASYF